VAFKSATSLLAASLLIGAAGVAHAATVEAPRARSGSEFTSDAPWAAPAPRKQLQWDSKGRWGLRLDMNQAQNRESDWKDVQAGAFFRISPSVQVGGAVSLGDRLASPQRVVPQDAAPRVHLETAFRF
jgi:hypothetical protein